MIRLMPEGSPSCKPDLNSKRGYLGVQAFLCLTFAFLIFVSLLFNEYASLGLWVLGDYWAAWSAFALLCMVRGYQLSSLNTVSLSSADKLREVIANKVVELEIIEQERGHLEFASKRFEELFQSIPTACFTFDSSGVIYEWNRAAEEMFGLRAHEAIQTSVFNTVARGNTALVVQGMIKDVFAGKSIEKSDVPFAHREGGTIHGLVSAFPLHDHAGQITGGVCAIADITQRVIDREELAKKHRQLFDLNQELEVANKSLAERADTDGLTGLYNHRKFRETFEIAYERACSSRPYCLLMLDVDEFKSYNDTFGHPAGDEVLRGVADVLREMGRGVRAFRYGGEEFAIIVRGGARRGVMVAEEIRQQIEDRVFPNRRITVSIGVTEHPGSGARNSSGVVSQADQALYIAKRSGRNQVCAFTPAVPVEIEQSAA